MIRKLIFGILCLAAISATAQTKLFLGGNLCSGYLMKSIDSKQAVLKSNFSIPALAGASLYLRLKDRIGIEAGVSQNAIFWKLRDQKFASDNSGYKVNINVFNMYYSFFSNFHIALPVDEYNTYVYFQGGLAYNVIGAGTVTEKRTFPINSQQLNMNARFSEYNISAIPEIGIQKIVDHRWIVAIGLNYNFSTRGDVLNGEYNIKNKDGVNITEDKFKTQGGYVGLNFQVKYQIAQLGKITSFHIRPRKPTVMVPINPDDSARYAEEQARKEREKQDEIARREKEKRDHIEDSLKHIPPPLDTMPKYVAGRKYTVGKQLMVNERKVTLIVWDDKIVDGDRITLYLNGEPVLENYTLVREKKEVVVTLKEGTNDLVLHALNLGRQPPNTAAVRVTDSVGTQQVIMKSDLKGSMAIQLIYNP